MPKRVTLADIATRCGVGKSTVARALSNYPHVRPELREKIRTKAQELGYRPDPGLRILAQYRWNSAPEAGLPIAIVNTSERAPKQYIGPVKKQVESLGYSLAIFNLWDYPTSASLAKVLFHRSIRGLIIPPVVEPRGVPDFDWADFCAVGCGHGEYRLPIHSVSVNAFEAVRICWQRCVALGYRRIGAALFRQPGPDENDAPRHAAIAYEQGRSGPEQEAIPLHDGSTEEPQAFLRWFKRYQPDALISLNDTPYWWLKSAGIDIPSQLGFCVVNCQQTSPTHCSGTSTMLDRIAENAVNWLDQLVRMNSTGTPETPQSMLVRPSWIEGVTLPPANQLCQPSERIATASK